MGDILLHRPDATLHGTRTGIGPPILLLHAGAEDRRVWRPVAALLESAGLSSVAYDLRGHGESDAGRVLDLPAHAGDVAAMLEGLPGAIVVGASLGGLAALLALGDPAGATNIPGLVLVDVVPDLPPARAKAFLRKAIGARADEPLVDDILSRATALRHAAARLRMPVMLVRGTESPITDDDEERLRCLVPGLRVSMIEGSGHLVARDAPAPLARQLIRFATSSCSM